MVDIGKLAELKRLLDEGALTREELELLKAREIGGSAPPPYEQGVVMRKVITRSYASNVGCGSDHLSCSITYCDVITTHCDGNATYCHC